MVEVLNAKQLRKLLRSQDKVFVGGLPFVGKTTLITEACGGLCGEKVQYIELPKEFHSVDELNAWKEKVDKVRRGVIEGRSYVIDLVLGKVTPTDKPSLVSPLRGIEGEVVKVKGLRAIRTLYKEGIRDDKVVSKVLLYSTVAMPDHYTVIPKLVNEGVELYKQGKLDKALNVVLGLKRLYALLLPEDVSGEEAIVHALGSVLPKGIDFKTAWGELSDTWKELVYYRLDWALGLLPGTAKKVLARKEVTPKGEAVSVPQIDPFFVDLAEWGKSIYLNGADLCIVGPIKSAKSTLADSIRQMIGEVDVVDYNNYNFLSLNEKLTSGERYIAVLTEDLYYSIPTVCIMIHSDKYISEFIDYLYLKENKRRKRPHADTLRPGPDYYYDLHELKYGMEEDEIEDQYLYEMDNYIKNTVFGGDVKLMENYLPLFALGKDYLPLPVKASEAVLKYLNKSVHEPFLRWFSAFYYRSDTIGEGVEIDKKQAVQRVREELIRAVKEQGLQDDLLRVYFDNVSKFVYYPETGIDGFVKTAYGNYSPLADAVLYDPDILEEFGWDLGDKLKETCDSLGELLKHIYEVDEDNASEVMKSALNIFERRLYNYAAVYRVLSSHDVDINCIRNAFYAMKVYVYYLEEVGVFEKLEEKLYDAVVATKDEELVREYMKMAFKYYLNTRSSPQKIVDHVTKIAGLSGVAKAACSPVYAVDMVLNGKVKPEGIKDPVEVFGALMGLIEMGPLIMEKDNLGLAVEFYNVLEGLYHKFTKVAKVIDDEAIRTVYDVVYDAELQDKKEFLDYISVVVDMYGFAAGVMTFYNYGIEGDFADALERIDLMVTPVYSYIVNEPSLDKERATWLLEAYKVKLAKELLTSKYGYKAVLQDIVDLYSKVEGLPDKTLKERVLLAYLISKLLLYGEVAEPIPPLRAEVLYRAALALTGKDVDGFLKEVEEIRVRGRPVTGLKLLREPEVMDSLAPILLTYFYLKGDKKGIEKVTKYVKKGGSGIPLFITKKIFDEINIKGNINKYIASLILYV
ncbi:hypothetical protein [Stygiolobus caldivivus]|uniref:hypothetical protein n=1 Tax=Stygiolobus caldivivus TaxID=2824673 RepID=UPI001C847F3F|nr:hypothetical protein [Stygiolobus caldivivus]